MSTTETKDTSYDQLLLENAKLKEENKDLRERMDCLRRLFELRKLFEEQRDLINDLETLDRIRRNRMRMI